MGGFQFNGCGAKDYFSKVKYLGERLCPECNRIAPYYLEKGKFKISVVWIPTVTLKERYAIMCQKCKRGDWIEDAEAYKILNGDEYKPIEIGSSATQKCPQCGEVVDGAFCGKCGTPLKTAESTKICTKCGATVDGDFCGICGTKYGAQPPSPPKPKCPKCGAEVEGTFCGKCGANLKGDEPAKRCAKCGAEIDGDFCGVCGTKYGAPPSPPPKPKSPKCGADVEDTTCRNYGINRSGSLGGNSDSLEWECSLCGTKNPKNSSRCSLCGCKKP